MGHEYGEAKTRHTALCRWWLKIRTCEQSCVGGAVHEFYVPFWAWPFEWLHRLIFGRATIKN